MQWKGEKGSVGSVRRHLVAMGGRVGVRMLNARLKDTFVCPNTTKYPLRWMFGNSMGVMEMSHADLKVIMGVMEGCDGNVAH